MIARRGEPTGRYRKLGQLMPPSTRCQSPFDTRPGLTRKGESHALVTSALNRLPRVARFVDITHHVLQQVARWRASFRELVPFLRKPRRPREWSTCQVNGMSSIRLTDQLRICPVIGHENSTRRRWTAHGTTAAKATLLGAMLQRTIHEVDHDGQGLPYGVERVLSLE